MNHQPNPPLHLAIVGAGPTASSFLERLSASAAELLGDHELVVHLIDPHPAGTGRIWRSDQSRLMWMNSMAEDVTMFTDHTVVCEGPIRPGPSLIEWATEFAGDYPDKDLTAELRALTGPTFPTRPVQGVYLDWFLAKTLAELPANVSVITHEARAVDLVDAADGRQVITLEATNDRTRTELVADAAVLALGHLDNRSEPDDEGFVDFARRHGLFHLSPANTADADLSGVVAGSPLILRGFGLAFVDTVVLLTEGRGGRYVERADGRLHYVPSGTEPVIHVGSRRGVPYRAKLGYRLQGAPLQLPKFFDADAADRLIASDRPLEFRRDIWPLLGKDIGWGYYQELFSAHPERTSISFEEFTRRYEDVAWESEELRALLIDAIPDPQDHFDVDRLDRPLQGLRFDSYDDLQQHLRAHISADLARRGDPAFSADLGAFMALLVGFGQLSRVIASGRVRASSKIREVDGWWFGFFSYFASGPPPARLRQLLALADAGLLKFLGEDMWVDADETTGRFRAGSRSTDHVVEAVGLIEARNPKHAVPRSADALIRSLYERGEVTDEVLVDAVDGSVHRTGKLLVDADGMRVVDANGNAHPRRHALGASTSRPAAGAFSRPRTNAPSFRQNDAIARLVLRGLVERAEPAIAAVAAIAPGRGSW